MRVPQTTQAAAYIQARPISRPGRPVDTPTTPAIEMPSKALEVSAGTVCTDYYWQNRWQFLHSQRCSDARHSGPAPTPGPARLGQSPSRPSDGSFSIRGSLGERKGEDSKKESNIARKKTREPKTMAVTNSTPHRYQRPCSRYPAVFF